MNSVDEQNTCKALSIAVEALRAIGKVEDDHPYLIEGEMRRRAQDALALIRRTAPEGVVA